MGIQDGGFEARIKRVQVQSRRNAPMHDQRRVGDDSFDEQAMSWAILLPQLAFILGAVALVAGRGIAMNYLMIEPSTDLLGLGEGCVIVVLLVGIGLLFGKSSLISHAAACQSELSQGLWWLARCGGGDCRSRICGQWVTDFGWERHG